MDQETMLRRLMTPAVKSDGDGLFTHAILPGLFRAAIVKPCNNKSKQADSNHCFRKRDTGIYSKHSVKRLGRPKVPMRSSNLSIADLILIANSSETLARDQTRPACPAYRFCVERTATAATTTSVAGVTVDQEDSVICSELPTLRELLEPIKQTAMRMKQLSQVKDGVPQVGFCDRSSQTNNNVRRSPWKARTPRGPVVQNMFRTRLGTMIYHYFEDEDDNVIEEPAICRECGKRKPQERGECNAFAEGDQASGVDGNVFLRIVSRPGIEADQIDGDPLVEIIRYIMSQMTDMQQSGRKGGPMMAVVDQYREGQDIGVQSCGYLKEKPSFSDDDSLSLDSYEFIKTMDIGCGGEPEARNDDIICKSGCQISSDVPLDPFLLGMLTMLKNNTEPTCSKEPKSRVSGRQHKSIGCTCALNPDPCSSYAEVKAGSKVEVTNKVSFKSSYFLENLETMNMESGPKDQPICCLKDVATSKISVYKQITSMSQSKVTRSRKQSSSNQCDIGPESIGKLPPNFERRGRKELESRKAACFKEQDGLPETIEELCSCGCGFFLEGDDTCSCGCGELLDSPCQVQRLSDDGYSIDSIGFNIPQGNANKIKASDNAENCYSCGCAEDPKTVMGFQFEPDVPKPKNEKRGNVKIKDQELMCDRRAKIGTSRNEPIVNRLDVSKKDCNKLDGPTNLEEEARKLQQKIQCYRKENEHFRKLIQQTCNSCQEDADALSRTPPIRATYSGLATAIEILQAKCRSKDSMIAVLAEGLRGVANYAQVAKNLAAPCLEYTYWDFDQSALYTYLRGTISRLSVTGSKDSVEAHCKQNYVPPPTDFKIGQQFCKCLLVSWKPPENVENVAGYRIYVNGNLATNVRSPTRTETILGIVDTTKPAELVLHSFNKAGTLSDPVTITYRPQEQNNNQ